MKAVIRIMGTVVFILAYNTIAVVLLPHLRCSEGLYAGCIDAVFSGSG